VNATVDPTTAATIGISLGTVIAVACSWERNKSILWAIVAGWLSWFYVVWFALTRREDERKSR
jgi:predicted MFS family arabinose efflux permease